MAIEVTVGLWIGLTARILMSALQFAGHQVGLVSGLANALRAADSGQFQGATLIAGALTDGGGGADLRHRPAPPDHPGAADVLRGLPHRAA